MRLQQIFPERNQDLRKVEMGIGMQLKTLLFAVVLAVTFNFADSKAQLPKEVQADILQDDIVTAIKRKDFVSAKNNIAKYRALGIALPPAIMIIDAKVAAALNEPIRAKKILEEYFKAHGKSDSGYQSALQLYKDLRPKIAQAQRIKAALEKAEIAKYKAIRIRNDCRDLIDVFVHVFNPKKKAYETTSFRFVPNNVTRSNTGALVKNGQSFFYYAKSVTSNLVWGGKDNSKSIKVSGNTYKFRKRTANFKPGKTSPTLRLHCDKVPMKKLVKPTVSNSCNFPVRAFIYFYDAKQKQWRTTSWFNIAAKQKELQLPNPAIEDEKRFYFYAESLNKKYQWGYAYTRRRSLTVFKDGKSYSMRNTRSAVTNSVSINCRRHKNYTSTRFRIIDFTPGPSVYNGIDQRFRH